MSPFPRFRLERPAHRPGGRLVAALIAALAGACGGGGGVLPPFTASDLVISPAAVGGRHRPRPVDVGGSLFLSGASRGLSRARVVSPGLLDLEIPVDLPTFTSGTLTATFRVTVSLPGHYPVEVWAVDGAGRESPHLHGAFDVVPHASCSGWTTATTDGPSLDDLAWTGVRFVGVGPSGVAVSSDAFDWTATPVTTPLTAVAWSGTALVALGDGAVLTSPDGLEWMGHPPAREGVHVEAVAWTGARFVAVGHSEAVGGPRPAILTSEDGVAWTERAVPAPPSSQPGEYRALTGLAWSGSLLVATSYPSLVPSPLAVFVSADGLAWEAVEIPPTPGIPQPQTLFDVAWLDTGFAAVGLPGVLFTSPDGRAWTQLAAPGVLGMLYEAVSTGPTLVAGGWPVVTCDLAGRCAAELPATDPSVRALVWSGLDCVAARSDGTILVSP